MQGLGYLLVEPACELNEKGTTEKNGGNENLSLDDNEEIEADSAAESFVEEDWNDPEQGGVPKWTEPDLPIPAGTRSGHRKRTGMRYNRYGDDFLIDKIQLDILSKELLSVRELAADDEWQIINDSEHYPQEDYSTPEQEADLEQSEIERRENTNFTRIRDIRVDARCQERKRRRSKHPTSRRVGRKTHENGGAPLRLDSNRQAARDSTR